MHRLQFIKHGGHQFIKQIWSLFHLAIISKADLPHWEYLIFLSMLMLEVDKLHPWMNWYGSQHMGRIYKQIKARSNVKLVEQIPSY